jgi:hypothetical protein
VENVEYFSYLGSMITKSKRYTEAFTSRSAIAKAAFNKKQNLFFIFPVQPTRCNDTQCIYFCEMLYMFQAVPSPIIRSSKLYIQHRVLSRLYCYLSLSWKIWIFTATCRCSGRFGSLLLPVAVVEDLDLYCYLSLSWKSWNWVPSLIQVVEHFTEINTLCNVESCWLYLKIHLRCTDAWMSKKQNLFTSKFALN